VSELRATPAMSTPAQPTSLRHRVVVVGGGFGGLNAVRTLDGADVDGGRRNSTWVAGSAAGGVAERPGLPFHSMSGGPARRPLAALACGMPLRIQTMLAVIASALLLIIGAYLGLTKGGTDTATLGWLLALVGAAGLVANLVLRARMR
jgi:hypothetical protein